MANGAFCSGHKTTQRERWPNMATATMKGLPSDLITSLMAKSRQHNAYGPKLLEFVNSDEAAINPAETWPLEFSGKKATTLYQGFRTAAEKANLSDQILIKQSDDNVFLLHKERVTLVLEATASEADDTTE